MTANMVELREVCEFTYGDGLKEENRVSGKIPVYGSNGRVGWHNQAITSGPTIVIGRKGSIGEINWSEEPCFPIDTTYYIEKTKKPCDLRWLYYTLLKLDLTRLNKSAAVPGLNRDDAYEKYISFPDLPTQERIAQYLDQADRLRRLRHYALEMSESFLPAVFVEMFGDPATNPREWPTERLGDVAKTTSGGTPDRKNENYYGGDIVWVKSGELHQHEVTKTEETITQLGLENSSAKLIPPGTILMAMYGATVGALSRLAIEAATNQAVCCITPDHTLNSDYLMGALRMLTHKLLSQRVGGAQPNISQEIVRDLLIPIAPLELQKKYSVAVVEYHRLQTTHRESLRQADHLFQSLLHQAFSGN